MPLVSVVIPTFNRGAFAKEAVESVLAQTFKDYELLVVDDGSTDETGSLLSPYQDAFRYLRQPHSGVSAARNFGIRESQGNWLAFLDSDDLWLPTKLQRQLQAVQCNRGRPLCYTDEIWIRNGARVNPGLRHRKYTGWIFEFALPLCIISPSSALISRELLDGIGGFDEQLPACEDYDMWLRVTLRHPVLFLDERLIIKRAGHMDQLSRVHEAMDRFRVYALWKILQDPEINPRQAEAVRVELRRKCGILLKGARKRGKEAEATLYERLMHTAHVEDGDAWRAVLGPSK